MAKFVGLILGICVFNAQCAVYRSAGGKMHRVVRSPHYGSNYFEVGLPAPPPPPPPPPFRYHTHNWSGVARGVGGARGVFSGAAATAESGFPGTNEAVSLAAADTSGGQSINCDDDFGAQGQSSQSLDSLKSTQSSSNSFVSGSGYKSQIGSLDIGSGSADRQSNHYNSDSSGFASNSARSRVKEVGSQSGQYSSGASDVRHTYDDVQQQNNGFGKSASRANAGFTGNSGFQAGQGYKESHLTSQNNDNNFGARERNAGLLNQGGFGANEQQSASKGFSSSQAQSSSFGSNGGISPGFSQGNNFANQKLGSGSSANGPRASGSQERFAAGNGNDGGSFANGYGQGRFESSNDHGRNQQLQTSSGGQSAGFNSDTNENKKELVSGSAGASAHGDVQSTLNGALDLASQGLQAADKAGCSTCQKSSFALSNAKSWNGNAVSLAIGG